jgi:hypothetical protein
MLNETHYPIAVTGKLPLAEPFRETGHFIPSTLSAAAESEVLALAAAATTALGITDGVTHTEVKMSARGYDLTRAALQVAAGQRPDPVPGQCGGVSFKSFLVAPQQAVRLRAVRGATETKAIPGITGVDVLAAPGQNLDWRAGNQRLGSVEGTAADHPSLRRVITKIEASFCADYEWRCSPPVGAWSEAENPC